MLARYRTLRQYLPSFFGLPFQAAAGSEPLLQTIEILRALDASARTPLTPDDPCGFVPADWRAYLVQTANLTAGFGKWRSHSPCVTRCVLAACT